MVKWEFFAVEEAILVLGSMRTENSVTFDEPACVVSWKVAKGDAEEEGQVIVILEKTA